MKHLLKTLALTYFAVMIFLCGIVILMSPAIAYVITGDERWMWLFFFTIPTIAGILIHYNYPTNTIDR